MNMGRKAFPRNEVGFPQDEVNVRLLYICNSTATLQFRHAWRTPNQLWTNLENNLQALLIVEMS